LQTDCDGNGIGEACETFIDCNANGIPDSCDLASGFAQDCNGNGKPDSCDLAASGSPYPGAVQWTVASGGNGHWYKGVPASSAGITWTDARTHALSIGGDLVSLNTLQERVWVFANVSNNSDLWTTTLGPWVGGFQPAGSSEPGDGWLWVDGTPVYEGFYWGNAGSPDGNNNCGGAANRMSCWGQYTMGVGDRFHDMADTKLAVCWNINFGHHPSSVVEWSTGLPTEPDCNANGIPDSCELANGGDCNNNGLLDACETFDQTTPDCNNNSVPDSCDIESRFARDCDLSGVPDSCEIAAGALDENSDGRIDLCNYAVGDFDLSNEVDASDLGFMLLFYGEENPPFGDLDGSGVCDSGDIGYQLLNFGPLE